MVANPIDTIQLDKVESTEEVFLKNDYPIVLSMQRFELEKIILLLLGLLKRLLRREK